MARKRGIRSPQFKAKVALAAIKGDKTLAELARKYTVHPTQIGQWRSQLLERAAELFEDARRGKRSEQQVREEELYEQIGRLKVELEWLKKTSELAG